MIIINSEETHISEEELFIGFAGDNLHSTRQFELTGVSDADCKYVLYLTFDNNTTTHFELDSKVENGSTYLTWNIEDEHVLKGGLVKARIKSIKKDGIIYHSPSMYFVASPLEDNPTNNSNGENNLTEELKNLIDVITAKVEDLEQDYVPATRTVAQLSLENDITAEQLQSALDAYPVLVSSSLDLIKQNTKKGQFAIYTNYDGKTFSYDLYYGYFDGGAQLIAGTTFNDNMLPGAIKKYLEENSIEGGYVDLSNYVPTTRTIAGCALTDDITVEQLQKELGINVTGNLYNGLSEAWGEGNNYIPGVGLNIQTLELTSVRTDSTRILTKAIPVKSATQYIIPYIGSSTIIAYRATGSYRGTITPSVDNIITTGSEDVYLVFSFNKTYYTDYANFCIKEYVEKVEYIEAPTTAETGQTIVVKSVDENGKPTEWETADFPTGDIDINDYILPILALTGDISAMDKDNAVTLSYTYKELSGTCDVKWQGSSSLTYPKKNFTIKFADKVVMDESWGEQIKYCAKANFIDYTHARNVVNAKLWGQIVKSRSTGDDRLNALPNGGAVDGFPIVITINGEFQGLYTMNIPKDGWMFGMGSGVSEAIVCADNHVEATQFKALATMAGDKADFELEYVSDEDNSDWVLESLNRLINSVMNSDGKDLNTTVAQYLDWESAIDYYIFTVMLGGGDMTDKNYLLATYDGIKWFFSAYDMDTTYGIDWDGKTFFSPDATVKVHSYATIHKVMELIKTYKMYELKQRYKELRGGVLSEYNVATMFNNFMASIPRPILEQDARRWPTIPSTNVNDINNILNWYKARCSIIDTEMESYIVDGVPLGVNLFTYGESHADYVDKEGVESVSGSVAVFASEKYIVRADAGGKSGLIYRKQDFETENSTYRIKATFTPRTEGLTAVKRVLLQCFDADGNNLTNVEAPLQGTNGYLDFYKGFYVDKEEFTMTFPENVKTFRVGFLSSIEPPTAGEFIHISNIEVIKES